MGLVTEISIEGWRQGDRDDPRRYSTTTEDTEPERKNDASEVEIDASPSSLLSNVELNSFMITATTNI